MEIWKMLKNLKIQLIVNKAKYGKPVLRYVRKPWKKTLLKENPLLFY